MVSKSSLRSPLVRKTPAAVEDSSGTDAASGSCFLLMASVSIGCLVAFNRSEFCFQLVGLFSANLACSSYTPDNPTTLNTAQGDPVGFVRGLGFAVIDGVQRAPEVLMAIKQSVDEDRRPGRFLFTGSANLMTLPRVWTRRFV